MKLLKINIFILFVIIISTTSLVAQEKKNNVDTTEFEVTGVCEMCKERIENAALIKGVKLAEWDKNTGMITVVYDTRKTTVIEIQTAIAEHGHDTSGVKASEKSYDKLPNCCSYRDGVHVH